MRRSVGKREPHRVALVVAVAIGPGSLAAVGFASDRAEQESMPGVEPRVHIKGAPAGLRVPEQSCLGNPDRPECPPIKEAIFVPPKNSPPDEPPE